MVALVLRHGAPNVRFTSIQLLEHLLTDDSDLYGKRQRLLGGPQETIYSASAEWWNQGRRMILKPLNLLD